MLHCTPAEAMERLTPEDLELIQAEYAIRAEEREERRKKEEEDAEQAKWDAEHQANARRAHLAKQGGRTMGGG